MSNAPVAEKPASDLPVAGWFLASVDEVAVAADAAGRAIEAAAVALKDLARAGLDGTAASDIVDGPAWQAARQARIEAEVAMQTYRRVMHLLRGRATRALVDDELLTLTAAGRLLQVSRQMAARLYGAIEGDDVMVA